MRETDAGETPPEHTHDIQETTEAMATFPTDQPGHEQPASQQQWEQWSTDTQFQPTAQRLPAVDIVDNSAEIWVYVDLPGFQPEEIHVRGDESTLLVSAERPTELEEGRNVVLHERATSVERTIPLPSPVQISGADLRYEEGVCKVVLPKSTAEGLTELEFHTD